ncbi:xanthine dehydrogenase family protein molybdopterin-binding subunit [Desulfospira joergensenii]|uniref:xanthine dehydrogenase family protein molybdopterin-binding subunit n=1 Tax=Desulfospira joergensenii TaxID=53329 RepID=UPI000428DC16|nr:molybdopterin cofactor-binding domain-containing protein [Desulfospira joergensenii]
MKKKGTGIGCMWYGIGNTGLPNPAAAFIEVLGDCSVNLHIGAADIGQGSTTAMAQIAAEELGLAYENINVVFADTMMTPEGGATSASRQTFVSGNAVLNAARQAKTTLLEVCASYFNCLPGEVEIKGGKAFKTGDPDLVLSYPELMAEAKKMGKIAVGAGSYNPKTTYLDPETMEGIPYELYSYATTIAEVEVDTETGEVEVLSVVSAHDVGQPIYMAGVEGQIEGGVAMGAGFAVMEETLIEEGRILNPIFSKYLIPTTMDIPEIHAIPVSSQGTAGPFGAKGVGEPALIPTIPAVTAAIENALGVTFTTLPITPQRVLEALEKESAE